MNFAHGAMFTLGAYLASSARLNFWAALFIVPLLLLWSSRRRKLAREGRDQAPSTIRRDVAEPPVSPGCKM